MTEQDFLSRVEISGPIGYTRAVGATPTDPVLPEPARATFTEGQPGAQGPAGSARPVWMPETTPPAYPLRARGADLRRRYRRGHDAADTPLKELAVLTDYVRSCLGSAGRAGMHDPQSATAVRAAIRALLTAGDTLTAAMHTWSPE
jgi:hypothetical protein